MLYVVFEDSKIFKNIKKKKSMLVNVICMCIVVLHVLGYCEAYHHYAYSLQSIPRKHTQHSFQHSTQAIRSNAKRSDYLEKNTMPISMMNGTYREFYGKY